MAANDINQITADVNKWAKYRDPDPHRYVDLTPQEVQAYYRVRNYKRPKLADLAGAEPQYRDLGPGQPLQRPPERDLDPGHRQFLDKHIPQLMNDPAEAVYWQGTKFLGEGGYGQVGLWEYKNPDPNANVPMAGRQVAVKELMVKPGAHRFSLMREAKNLNDLVQGNSPHIVRLLLNPPDEQKILGSQENLGPEWDRVVRRIFLEYCPLGSLMDLIQRRIRLGVPFSELTLWRIFDCLVDGISALEYNYELQSDLATGQFFPEPAAGWIPKVHFDLKPDNVLLADRRTIHATHPLCKLADLGSARNIKEAQEDGVEKLRIVGTELYHAPEQFTERWDYADWQQGKIAGVYGAATNVWGIGCIMYQLLVMSLDPPDHTDPFIPAYDLSGEVPKSITYGVDLSMYPYSETLRDLIHECLYEKPSNRPKIPKLKSRVYDCMEACIQAGDPPEPWVDFLPAEPLPPDVANPPALPALPAVPTEAQKKAWSKVRTAARKRAVRDEKKQAQTAHERNRTFLVVCRHFFPNNKQCRNSFKTDGTQIYCEKHGA